MADINGEMIDGYKKAIAEVFSSKDFPKTDQDIGVESITDGFIPTARSSSPIATRRRLLQVPAVKNVNLATKVRISARK